VYWHMIESRSDDDYGKPEGEAAGSSWDWSDILLFPVVLFLVFVVLPLTPFLVLMWHLLGEVYSSMRAKIKSAKESLSAIFTGVSFAVILARLPASRHADNPHLPTETDQHSAPFQCTGAYQHNTVSPYTNQHSARDTHTAG
jgi:hypothetical protein